MDKTQYIHKLFHEGKPYFLSRPRRFGKSLLLSTMRAFFEGKKELFKGLKIEELERNDPDAWQEYPVFYIDFNKKNFRADSALEQVLEAHLTEWEAVYGNENAGAPLEMRFQYLVRKAAETSGKNVVILVDEYDKPLLEGADNEMIEHNKAVFKGFFSTLKSYDRYIKFVFITGVTKFSKVSISSDLNQLNDISLDNACGGICGITEGELKSNFIPEVGALAEAQEISTEECYAKLGKMYDGYHFGNKEVKYGFLKSLAPYYLCAEEESNPMDLRSFVKDIRKGDTEALRERFTALFARLPYPSNEKVIEQNFQNVIYIVFMLLGQFTMSEIHSAKGRADCIVETDDYVYIFEFKRDKSALEALGQIEEAGYAKPYAADKRSLLKIGVNFDSKERTISGWEVRKELSL